MRRKRNHNIVRIILFCLGMIICSYPLISSISSQYYLNDTVATYQKQVEACEDSNLNEMITLAEEYNRVLHQSEGSVFDDSSGELLSSEYYNHLLDLSGNGIMGSVEIPGISVNLPIYHGTSEEVLAAGAGHIEGTSLPIGGENTRTVLSGHRGLPSAKLFTRLDELKVGDLFFIRVCNEILAYEVIDIDVIDPYDVEKLRIVSGKDLATLLTCTPYGLNTHRLIVTGERVPYIEKEYEAIEKEIMSYRELFFGSVPFVFAVAGIGVVVKKIKFRNKGGNK